MEAAPRLPMINLDLLSSTEIVQFGKKLKPYIASFYNEDPESYNAEINQMDMLRVSAIHPSPDVSGVQLLKKYYCQLHFLKSRFPMEYHQPCYIEFEWKDFQNAISGGINLELTAIMYNIGALHTILGAQDSRSTPEGMKLAYSHFQCAAWAFQVLKEKYSEILVGMATVEVAHFYKQVCLAQAQECILEKSMLDNRKSTIISKVAVQVFDYYRQALSFLKAISEDIFGRSRYKDWMKYLQFKMSYHRCMSLFFQGQQAEELQKTGERVAFYQAACEHLEEAKKQLTSKQQKDLADALAFTANIVERKKKAAENENEFIYHEEVPDISNLQEVKGAPLVKLIEFNVNDPEVSGPDIFSRLVPMEAHEAASLYSERKAQLLRSMGEQVEIKDQALVEFMSSMQLDLLTKMHQATGIPQELIDRAAALSAKPNAIQDLIDSMGKLSSIYHDVESNLNEIEALLKEEEDNEKSYQEIMGKRPNIITTDLAREASKYKEAHMKANDSNLTLKKAMMTHMENLKILQTPIRELQQRLPSVEMPDTNIDHNILKELEMLNSKVDEMKTQRAMLWAQLRESVHNDDITNALVTKPQNISPDELFNKELEKHNSLLTLLEQNLSAQDNIKKAFIDCYARAVNTRRYIQDIIQKRSSTVQALITSHDSYDDLLAKANKGIEFYTKLETNVSKLLQRIKSASKVQQEEREQMLAKSMPKKVESVPATPVTSVSTGLKLKDYLEARKKAGPMPTYPQVNYGGLPDSQNWPPSVRPAPVGSEINADPIKRLNNESAAAYYQQPSAVYGQPAQSFSALQHPNAVSTSITDLTNRMGTLMGKQENIPITGSGSNYNLQYSYSNYIPQNYSQVPYTYVSPNYTETADIKSPTRQDASKASTLTTNSYQTISSYMQPGNVPTPYDGSGTSNSSATYTGAYQYQAHSANYTSPVSQPSVSQSQTTKLPGANQSTANYPQNYPNQYFTHYQGTNQYTQPQTPAQLKADDKVQYPSQYYQSQTYSQQYSLPTPQSSPYVTLASHQQYAGNTLHYTGQTAVSSAQMYYAPQNVNISSDTKPKQDTSGQSAIPYSTGPSQTSNVQQSISTQPVTNTGNYGSYQTGVNYPDQQLGYSSVQQGQQNYYPYGYSPNFSPDINTASQNMYNMSPYQQQYYTQQHASSVASTQNKTYSTYSSPSSDIYKVQPGSANSYNMSTGQPQATYDPNMAVSSNAPAYSNYGSIYGYSQANYQTTVTTASYTQPTASAQISNTTAQQPAPIQSKESNVDLLSGLDFSATQIPTLTPQQNVAVEKKKIEPEAKPEPVDIKPQPSVPVRKEPVKDNIRVLPTQPLNNSEVKILFNQELEKYEKYVETLTMKTLSGPTTLDVKWKEIQDCQEPDNLKRVISVARCYPMKNRYPDILPYDYSRVELKSTNDDYINASFVQQLSPFTPQFIVTQAPLPSTYGDFWTMVLEQQVELIFCPLNEKEIGNDVYWPSEKGKNLNVLNMVISLQNIVVKPNWIERVILISVPEKKESWVVMHLQFISWPGSLFPTTPEPFISFVLELINLFQQQKCCSHPVMVHCSSGIGRSGLICLLTDAILNVTNQANAVPDLALLASKLGNYRKNILRDREHLRFAYEAMLCYMKQVLLQDNMKKKLSEVVPVKEEQKASDVQESIIDPLSTLDPFWASKK
ncbi:hypothetical protein GWI33_018816 [Rhynchophorus ferrugineus]|uniref:Tyrosine-protein phosphatase non-receptor type 23 n=1 Tax=Rhynchophorus ferrugineus TaxID=354439 RepID=A0A834HZH2_RHYFE|nr:hypothetical protein GWI33_018816 [Rhynchophorus ferrugineus]